MPRATYGAITFLAVFNAFAFWCFISAFGIAGVVAALTREDFANLPFEQAGTFLGETAVKVMQVTTSTSFPATPGS